ncbi:hypothetical protein [Salibaculum halophilum]|uniref:hypothetical protein n=1 Tax=Salibaculum halophilum TaxID=1914408 RepID=UPI0031839B9C
MPTRLSVVIVEEDRARAIAIVDALKDAHVCDAIAIDNSSGLARRIAAHAPDIVLIDIDNRTRGMMEELTLASGPLERPVAMFVSGDAGGLAQMAIEAGVSAYVVDGLTRAACCPVNVVDQPDLCDVTTPALVDRDPVVVVIGSEGTAPVLTRKIKTRLERMLPGNLGGLAALARRLRADVSARVPRQRRRAFWGWVFKRAPRAA